MKLATKSVISSNQGKRDRFLKIHFLCRGKRVIVFYLADKLIFVTLNLIIELLCINQALTRVHIHHLSCHPENEPWSF